LDEVLHTFTSSQFQRVTGKEAFTWASPAFTVLHNNVGIVDDRRTGDDREVAEGLGRGRTCQPYRRKPVAIAAMLDPLLLTGRGITVGAISVGSRADFAAMNRAIALHRLRPVIDRTSRSPRLTQPIAADISGRS
jgi:hypothetical protein